jgi:hypothetical protein
MGRCLRSKTKRRPVNFTAEGRLRNILKDRAVGQVSQNILRKILVRVFRSRSMPGICLAIKRAVLALKNGD